MGWNEARIKVVADRWQLIVSETTAVASSGENVVILSTERIEDSTAPILCPEKLESWLIELGFVSHERWKESASFVRKEVLVNVFCESHEVSSLSVQFTLAKDSPSRWSEWRDFVERLCEEWPVAIGDSELGMKVGSAHLFSVLRRTIAWQDFERHFGWPNPDECDAQKE